MLAIPKSTSKTPIAYDDDIQLAEPELIVIEFAVGPFWVATTNAFLPYVTVIGRA